MSRSEFDKRTKVQAFERSNGLCELCGTKLHAGKFHYDHTIPDALGGPNTLENCKVVCTACHSAKTTTKDVPRIAKMKRQHAKHIGANKPRSNMQGRPFSKPPPQQRASRPLTKTCNRF